MQKNIDSVVTRSSYPDNRANPRKTVLDLRQNRSVDYLDTQTKPPEKSPSLKEVGLTDNVKQNSNHIFSKPDSADQMNQSQTVYSQQNPSINPDRATVFQSSPEKRTELNGSDKLSGVLNSIDPLNSAKSAAQKFKRLSAKFISGIFSLVILPSIIVYLSSVYLISPFTVSGSSMEPTLHNFDHILVSKFTIKIAQQFNIKIGKTLGDIKRGDPVVFLFDENSADNQTYFVKRVIGLPGEKIKLTNGTLTIINDANPNGFVLNEDYIEKGSFTSGSVDLQLGDDEFFVLGDNRKPNGSYDSRSWGSLKFDKIVGVVKFRILPKEKIGTIKGG